MDAAKGVFRDSDERQRGLPCDRKAIGSREGKCPMRSDHSLHRILFPGEMRLAAPTDRLLGSENEKEIGISNQYLSSGSRNDCPDLQRPMANRDLLPGYQATIACPIVFGDERECGPNPNLDCINGYSSLEVPADEIAVPMESVQSAGDDPAKFDTVYKSMVVVIPPIWRAEDPAERFICEAIIRLMSWTAEGGLIREDDQVNDERTCFYDK